MNAQLMSKWERQNLIDLTEDLRRAGFPVGTSELIDATTLLLVWKERDLDLEDHTRLRSRLRPVFCKSVDQQQRFDPIFDEWWSRLTLTYRPALAAMPAATAARSSDRTGRFTSLSPAAYSVMLAVACFVGYAVYTSWIRPVTPATTAAASSTSPSSTAVAGTSGPDDTNGPLVDRLMPSVRDNIEIRPRWVWLAGAIPLCAFISFSLPLLVLSRTRLRRRSEPMFLDLAPLTVEARRLVPPMPPSITDRLARHVRSHGIDIERFARRPSLDIRRTIEATLRSYGIPTLRFSVARVHPSYVVLIDVANERDPRGRLFYQWADRLRREGLDVQLLLLRRTASNGRISDGLRFCEAALAGRGAEHWMPLTRLRAPAFGERLIIISDGDPLVDAEGRWRPEAERAMFHRWHDRALFTPVEPRDWGEREESLERAERVADPGFIVLPLEESALSAWTDLVLTGQLSTVTLKDPQRFPALLRKGGGRRFVGHEAPSPETLERLIQQLQIYLGDQGFYWLTAIAVTPVVRWELTLLLGKAALRRLPRLTNNTSLNASLARNYRRLVRLPWLQREAFPDWLRLRLLLELSEARQRELREVVEDLLEKLPPRAIRDGIELNFERPPGTEVDWRDQRLDESEPRGHRDLLYLGYMSGVSPEQLVLRAPRQWASWARQLPLRRATGWRRWLGRARERVRARFARWAWVDGLPHLGINRRRMLQMLALALPLMGGLAAATRLSPAGPLLASTPFFEERAHARVVPVSSPRCVAFSPDSSRLLSFSADGTLQWRTARTGAPIAAPLHLALDKLWDAAPSPDGQRIVSGEDHGIARIWDTQNGRERLRLTLPAGEQAFIVAFSPDGQTVATGTGSALRLWDAQTGRAIRALPVFLGIDSLAFSPDGARLISGGHDSLVRFWNARNGFSVGLPLRGHTDAVRSVAFSPNGRRVAAGGEDGTLRLWDAETGNPIGAPMTGHTGSVNSIVFSRDGRRLVSAGSDGTLRLWDGETGASIGAPLTGHISSVRRVAISPDGRRIVSASTDNTLRLWDWLVAEPIGDALKGHTGAVYGLAFSPDGRRLASGSADGTVRLWNAPARNSTNVLLRGHQRSVTSIAFSPDGNRLVSASMDATVRLWDTRTGTTLSSLSGEGNVFMSVAFSRDGTVACAGTDGSVHLWDTKSGSTLRLQGHTGPAWSLAFSPDGRYLASGSDDRTVRLWTVATAQPAGTPFEGHAGAVISLAFSPDGRRLVSGSRDRTVRIWNVQTWMPLGPPLRAHLGTVSSVAFTGDGRRVVSASSDFTLRVWDAETGDPIGSPIDVRGTGAMAVSPTGPYVAVGTADSQGTGQFKSPAVDPASLPGVVQLFRINVYIPEIKRGAAPAYEALVQLAGNMSGWQLSLWLLGAVFVIGAGMFLSMDYRVTAALERFGSRS